MPAPWEKYATKPAAQSATPKPWEKYGNQAQTTLGSAAANFAGGGVDALLTLPGAVNDLMLFGMDKLGQQYGARPLTAEEYADNPLGSNTVRSMFKDYVSEDMFGPEAKTTAEKYARRVGEFVGPGAALGPLNPRTILAATTGGVGSRAAQDIAPDSAWAPIIGGLLGGLAPSGVRALTGGGISATQAKLAGQMVDEGIPIYPGQSGSKATRVMYDALARLPFMGSGARNKQLQAFNAAIARTFGENADSITPEVMNAARARLSKQFNEIFDRNSVPVDQQLLTELGELQVRALTNLTTSQADDLGKALSSIINEGAARGGALPGRTYHAFTSKGGALQNLTSHKDPNIKFYAGQIREALDDAFARGGASADDIAKLKQTKQQWRSLKVVEPLAVKATDGNISPALLLGRVAANDKSLAYTGGGKLGTLARGAKEFLKEQPSSTTAERQMIYGALGSGGVAAGYMAPQVLAPAAALYGGARVVKALMESRTIGGAMVARALKRAEKTAGRQQRLPQAATAALPGSVGVAGRQNVPIENRPNRPRILPRPSP